MSPVGFARSPLLKFSKRGSQANHPPRSGQVYFIPGLLAIYVGLGLLDFLRNKRRTLGTLDRYFCR